MTGLVRMHACRWPQCHRKLKYGTWCSNHWYQLPESHRVGVRTDPQPDDLVASALGWIARQCPLQCARCREVVDQNAAKVRIHWPWVEARDLVIDLCEACTVKLETGLGIRWCDACALWVHAIHPVHGSRRE